MIIGRVVGTVVSVNRSDEISEARYLLVEQCNQKIKGTKNYHVVLDALGAGEGEIVIVSQGSSARQTRISNNKAVDAIVTGIVDLIEEKGELVYRK